MPKRISLKDAIENSGYKKKYIAQELGIEQPTLSRLLRDPLTLSNDKLKVERLCQLLRVNVNDIDWSVQK